MQTAIISLLGYWNKFLVCLWKVLHLEAGVIFLQLEIRVHQSPFQNPLVVRCGRINARLWLESAHHYLLALPTFLTASSTLFSLACSSPETLAFLLQLECAQLLCVIEMYMFCYLPLECYFSASFCVLLPIHLGLCKYYCLTNAFPTQNDYSPPSLIYFF